MAERLDAQKGDHDMIYPQIYEKLFVELKTYGIEKKFCPHIVISPFIFYEKYGDQRINTDQIHQDVNEIILSYSRKETLDFNLYIVRRKTPLKDLFLREAEAYCLSLIARKAKENTSISKIREIATDDVYGWGGSDISYFDSLYNRLEKVTDKTKWFTIIGLKTRMDHYQESVRTAVHIKDLAMDIRNFVAESPLSIPTKEIDPMQLVLYKEKEVEGKIAVVVYEPHEMTKALSQDKQM